VRGRGRADPGAVIDEFDGSGEDAAGLDGAVTVDHDGAVVSRGPEGVVADCADDDVGSPWSLAHPTRRYDYWLGGKENFAADRESGDAVTAAALSQRSEAHHGTLVWRDAPGRRGGRPRRVRRGCRGPPSESGTHRVVQ
jgi:hypothetical protein